MSFKNVYLVLKESCIDGYVLCVSNPIKTFDDENEALSFVNKINNDKTNEYDYYYCREIKILKHDKNNKLL